MRLLPQPNYNQFETKRHAWAEQVAIYMFVGSFATIGFGVIVWIAFNFGLVASTIGGTLRNIYTVVASAPLYLQIFYAAGGMFVAAFTILFYALRTYNEP